MISFGAFRAAPINNLLLFGRELYSQLVRDLVSDFILNLKQLLARSFVTGTPKLQPALDIDKLRANQQHWPTLPDTPGYKSFCAKGSANAQRIFIAVLMSKNRASRYNLNLWQLR